MTTDKDREEARALLKAASLHYSDAVQVVAIRIARIRQEAFDQGIEHQKEKQIADAIARTENALPSQRNSLYAYGTACGDLNLLASEVKRLKAEMQTIRQEAKAEELMEAVSLGKAEWFRDTRTMWNTIQEIREKVGSDGTQSILSDIDEYVESAIHRAEPTKASEDVERDILTIDRVIRYPEHFHGLSIEASAALERLVARLKEGNRG
jgi:antitoxin component of RelBE/YafQ-DinJ toxin-antitoxin module